ncbi:MAG: sigma 54-interacting transcriptional regulator, partial [Kofleriaceae bacterium]|nr:sigma 54-interacting transcriptional regulator [Kofleriaceae bacterium]
HMQIRFHRAVKNWSSNPFRLSAKERELDRQLVLEGPIATELNTRIDRGNVQDAKELVLAVGQAQACAPGILASELLASATIPASLLRKLPRKRSEYVRVVAAAGRAYHALLKIKGSSEAMAGLRREIWAACFGESLQHALELEKVIRDHDVLILGETGTRKEGIAEVFLEAAPGPANGSPAPRSALNAAAIPETLVESELFGHEKGAFTGASEARKGRLRTAAGGSFFLDEVGDLPSTTQVKLLRVIETNEIYPVGSDTPHLADLRYIAATHKDLSAMVEKGLFRRDLLERLAGITLKIPPLRDRPDDIWDIGQTFIASYLRGTANPSTQTSIERWLRSSEARNHRWPGNVRELQNTLRSLMLGLPAGLQSNTSSTAQTAEFASLPKRVAESQASLRQVEDWYIEKTLSAHGNNLTQAARILGVDRSTLRRRIRK